MDYKLIECYLIVFMCWELCQFVIRETFTKRYVRGRYICWSMPTMTQEEFTEEAEVRYSSITNTALVELWPAIATVYSVSKFLCRAVITKSSKNTFET